MDERWRNQAVSAAEYITGAEGPLRAAFDWLRSTGLGERVIKSAIAAVLAWELVRLLPGNPTPVLAPLTAVFSINLTVAGGMRDAGQRILGVLFGIGLALLINEHVGSTGLAIGLVVLVSFYVGRRLGLEPGGVQQLAVSALLIVLGAAGTQVDNIAALHLTNTLIGTGIGLLLNASVAPPDYLPPARAELLALGEAVHDDLRDLSAALRSGITYEEAVTTLHLARESASLHEIDAAMSQAEESPRYNLLGRRPQDTLAIYRETDRAQEHAAIQTRIMARALADATAQASPAVRPDWLRPGTVGIPLAGLVDLAAETLQGYIAHIRREPGADSRLESGGALVDRLNGVQRAAQDHAEALASGGWIYLGECVALATQLVADLSNAPAINLWNCLGSPILPGTLPPERR